MSRCRVPFLTRDVVVPLRSRHELVAALASRHPWIDTRVVTIERPPVIPSEAPRRGASLSTIVLGFACIGGSVGMIVGAWGGMTVLGMELPDHADLLPFCMMIGAGTGWLLGVGLASIVGKGARPAGPIGRRLVLSAVLVVSIVAVVISPTPVGWPQVHITFFSFWRVDGGTWFEIAFLADAAIAFATFLAVSGQHDGEGSHRPGRVAGATGIAGLSLGGLVFLLGTGMLALTWSDAVAHQKYRVVNRTTNSLASAASRREERAGSFPASLDEVLAAGGRIQPGAKVEFAGIVNGSFCVRVGVDEGEGDAGDPHYSALVHSRPPGSNAWIGSETWAGNSCTSVGGIRPAPREHRRRNVS